MFSQEMYPKSAFSGKSLYLQTVLIGWFGGSFPTEELHEESY